LRRPQAKGVDRSLFDALLYGIGDAKLETFGRAAPK